LRKGGGRHHLSFWTDPCVKKLAPLFVLVAATGCARSDASKVEANLEKRGFEVVGCEEAGELIFSCQLESGRDVQAVLYDGN
jgi:hypothetical protein